MLTWLGQWWLKKISHFILGKCIVDCYLYLIEYPQSLLHPLRMVYVHNLYHKFGKLCPRWRKCIFIRYNEHSKWYVFIGEHEDETILELESWDVTFLKDNFPCMGEIDRDLHFHTTRKLIFLDKNLVANCNSVVKKNFYRWNFRYRC